MRGVFWLRWAWRDLRERWLQVAAIALIIGLGTGMFAGLGGQETWRIESMDMSYEALQLHDLRVRLTTGSFVHQDAVLAALNGIEGVARIEPRLVMDTLVDASTADETILVSGRLIGVDPREGGPFVDQIYNDGGRSLEPGDADVAVLETKFARYYDLEPAARLTLIGDVELDVVGLGQSPLHFQIVPEEIGVGIQGEANMAVLYVPLSTAQAIYQRQEMVNDLRIQLGDGADRRAVEVAVESELANEFPEIGFQITAGEDDPVRTFLYADAEEDQEMLDLIAIFFLLGAALAAFNLAGRIVESQRRQIGIGMALGAPPGWIALRPLLVGLEIAVIGVLLGLPVGLAFTRMFTQVMVDFVPLPHYAGTMLHPPSFLIAAALGIVLPLLATLIPVWRAVRAEPLEAIHGHLAAKSSGLNRWLKGLALPGNTFSQMPLKNVLRSPKRTLLTVLGVGVAIALLFLFLGLLDTMIGTLDQAERALLHRSPDRVIVTLDAFYPVDRERVQGLAGMTTEDGAPLFSEAEPGLQLTGQLQNGAEGIDTLVDFYPTDSAIWVPSLLDGDLTAGTDHNSIIISRKAADDLGVEAGDQVSLKHPFREGPLAFRTVSTRLTVAGIHDNPLRGFSYVALEDAALAGLDGMTNVVVVTPGEGLTLGEVQRALFGQPGIMAVQSATAFTEILGEFMGFVVTAIRIMQGAVLVIALLIAFNSTSINIDDRVREVATMFAFGVRRKTVTCVLIGENAILGLLGTVLGGLLGWVLLNQLLAARMEVMMEELGLVITMAPLSLVLAGLLGVGVVALTPLLSARKLGRIDVPSTLRVIE